MNIVIKHKFKFITLIIIIFVVLYFYFFNNPIQKDLNISQEITVKELENITKEAENSLKNKLSPEEKLKRLNDLSDMIKEKQNATTTNK